MLKNIEDITTTKKRITLEIPASAFEEEIQKALSAARAKTRLPGFRPGKAPLALIEKKFYKEIEAEAMEKVVPKFYNDALTEAKVTPVADPVIESGMEFKRHSPMSLTFTLEIRPEIGEISYDGITVSKISTGIEDKDIEETLMRLREERAMFEPSEAPAKDDDLVLLDYEEREEGKSHKDEAFRVGADSMPLGFYEKINGLKKGDNVTIEVQYPADHHLAGKIKTFDVTVKEVKNAVLPELDDEFAKDLGLEGGVAGLRDRVRERLSEAREKTAKRIMKAEAMKKLVERYSFDLPATLVDNELGSLIDNARVGGRKEENQETMRAEFKPMAERNVRASMLLQTIAEREKVDVTEDEIRNRIMEIALEMRMSPENVMKYYISRDGSLDGLRHGVIEEKVLDIVLGRVAQTEEAVA